MRKSRFSVEQIAAVLKQVKTGLPVADAIRRIGISEQTFYRWKKEYGGLQPDQARELKQLQEENARLKRLVAESAWQEMAGDKVKFRGERAPSGNVVTTVEATN